jgi:hypothetical protein
MTYQEIYDKIVDHFVVQMNPRSIKTGTHSCMYRGAEGAKCAFGLFIPDEVYDPKMENETVRSLYEKIVLRDMAEKIWKQSTIDWFRENLADHDLRRFAASLQSWHDNSLRDTDSQIERLQSLNEVVRLSAISAPNNVVVKNPSDLVAGEENV